MRESAFQGRVRQTLQGEGAMVLNLHGHSHQVSGWPDLFVAHWTWRGWLELKTGKRKLTALQRRVIDELRLRGEQVWVLRYTQDGVSLETSKGVEVTGWSPAWIVNGAELLARLQEIG